MNYNKRKKNSYFEIIKKENLKICIMGAAFDTGNMGVSALAASLITLIRKLRPDCNISFFLGRRSSDSYSVDFRGEIVEFSVINYRLSPKAVIKNHLLSLFVLSCIFHFLPFERLRLRIVNINEQLKKLCKIDVFGDIRGGDSFSDIYGLRKFIIGSLPCIICFLLNKHVVLLPQTYGPYKTFISRFISRHIFKNASIILSRDKESVQVVKKLLKGNKTQKIILFCPDVAFWLTPRKPSLHIIEPTINEKQTVIGFNVSGLLYHGGYTKNNMFGLKMEYKTFAKKMLEKFLSETDAEILLIPHTFTEKDSGESDTDACNEIYSNSKTQHRKRIHQIKNMCDQSEIKYVIGHCDFFVGSRMHACIAAISQSIPTVGLAYSKKFIGVFDSIGMGKMVIDARKYEEAIVIEKIMQYYNDRNYQKFMVQGRIKEAQGIITKTFNQILDR